MSTRALQIDIMLSVQQYGAILRASLITTDTFSWARNISCTDLHVWLCSAHTWSAWIQCYRCWIWSIWWRSYIWWSWFIRWSRYIWRKWFNWWKSHSWLICFGWRRCYRCCRWFIWWMFYSLIFQRIINLWSCKHFHILLDIFQKTLFCEYLSTAKS